jgi:hypothetical protein
MMTIGTFRRHVGRTLTPKATKLALRGVSKNTVRTHAAHGAVSLKTHTGQLLQATSQYLLGLQMTQEMKDNAAVALGDIGYDLTVIARVLKAKMPSSTKKVKLVGTRAAALLQLDSLATDLLHQAEQGLFAPPKMTTVKKMVNLPNKGGAKEERDVEVVDTEADTAVETERQTQMTSFLAGALDVYWRLCFDMTGKSPESVLAAKFERMQVEFPNVSFVEVAPKPKAPKPTEPVPA